ncbi:preprotein translocase subunit SecY [Streptomyces fractus]|uniref:preprotein translocase subunit SecY n=1 Tax=Streptomyces fractus TaxID=641806 RepID=UPI003CEC7030
MLSSVSRAFKTPDLRKKLLFTLSILVIFRLGATIPAPGVNYQAVSQCVDLASASSGGVFAVINMFSGGALLHLSVFALGIMPYITASIVLQLLTVVIPRLESLKKEGPSGTAKITQYTRYLTVALALLQATGLAATIRSGALLSSCPYSSQIMSDPSVYTMILMIVTMVAGTTVIMWLGELITERGVGNGMSLLMFTSIAATFPASLWAVKQQGGILGGWFNFAMVVLLGLVLVCLVVFMEQAQRRIPLSYAKRMVGRKHYGGATTYLPLKVNQAGVVPVIFASSLLYLPSLIVGFSGSTAGWAVWIQKHLSPGSDPVYLTLDFLMIVFFAFFYVSISFNTDDIAEQLLQSGGFVPGIRAGRPTASYLKYVVSRITWPGSLYLGLIAMVPTLGLVLFNSGQNMPLGGTSLLIIVGVGLDTVKQIDSKLHQHDYGGFLR